MASSAFKASVTERFNRLVEMLNKTGLARNNSEVAALMNQPVQIMAKLLNGDRIVTLEQASALSQNAGVNSDWLFTGKGSAFKASGDGKAEKENLITRITTAMFQGEISKSLGEDIIEELMAYRDKDEQQLAEINKLNKRIIKMLELSKKFSS